MKPLRDVPAFQQMMTSFSNPIIGIAVGALFTAVIQSSSAAIGILQALAFQGLIGLDSAVFVLFGMNIGTCITSILSSIGTNRNARRTALVHLLFNIIGTAIFVAISTLLPFTDWVKALARDNPKAQIALAHTIFNVVTTLLLLPAGPCWPRSPPKLIPGEDRVPRAAQAPVHRRSHLRRFLDGHPAADPGGRPHGAPGPGKPAVGHGVLRQQG